MEHVLLLIVKGNLRHRVGKLGTELEEDDLTPAQSKLRKIAKTQLWHCYPPERPSWANGAFLYLEPSHAHKIKDAVQRNGVHLQSKHILVSPTHYQDLLACLYAKQETTGRESFLISRAGQIQTESKLILWPALPAMSYPESESGITKKDNRFAWLRMLEHNVTMSFCSVPMPDMHDDDKLETLNFVTAPVSVQEMAIRNWEQADGEKHDTDDPRNHIVRVWDIICYENSFLQMKRSQDEMITEPRCILCNTIATIEHLQSEQHNIAIRCQNEAHGPLLEDVIQKDFPSRIPDRLHQSAVSCEARKEPDSTSYLHSQYGHKGTRFYGQRPPPPPTLPRYSYWKTMRLQ